MMTPYYLKETLLKLENVSLKLGEKLILRDINVEVKDIVRPDVASTGQIIGFLGPSGIGKTKLFEVIAGLIKPTTGTVKLDGDQHNAEAGQVGVVQQNYPLFNHRTVLSNLRVAAKMCTDPACAVKSCKGCDKSADERVKAMLERFNLVAQKDHYPTQLSGGQRQRVAIAQQLLCSGQFLLLDEPFSGLDPSMTDEVSKMLVEIANEHEDNTIIIVSHDISATTAIADTLWVMGRDRNPDGSLVPGAYIKHNYNLIDEGLAYHPELRTSPQFVDFVWKVRSIFPTL